MRNDLCARIFGGNDDILFTENMGCTITQKEDACDGDTGDPLILSGRDDSKRDMALRGKISNFLHH